MVLILYGSFKELLVDKESVLLLEKKFVMAKGIAGNLLEPAERGDDWVASR